MWCRNKGERIMKYIRTKAGEIYNIDDLYICGELNGKPYGVKNSSWVIYKESVIKQANTIKELCDAYVITSKQGHIYDTYGDYGYELKEVLPQARKECPDEDWNLYGCILVDGIIKQVAKMNDKGELELL